MVTWKEANSTAVAVFMRGGHSSSDSCRTRSVSVLEHGSGFGKRRYLLKHLMEANDIAPRPVFFVVCLFSQADLVLFF